MIHVDHDPAASRLAAFRCREAADAYRRAAELVGTTAAWTTWGGCEAEQVRREVDAVCGDLRREAAALDATADALDAATARAWRADWDREQAARAARARAAAAAQQQAPVTACTPTSSEPSWGHAR